jgi:hypothetical protein
MCRWSSANQHELGTLIAASPRQAWRNHAGIFVAPPITKTFPVSYGVTVHAACFGTPIMVNQLAASQVLMRQPLDASAPRSLARIRSQVLYLHQAPQSSHLPRFFSPTSLITTLPSRHHSLVSYCPFFSFISFQ